ncbi:hypothetical protein SP90_08495 [Halodesulfovibrio spirochaetisodalis]|uniref:Uncharacterized protein n=1 Tax=Halodesulfovibrio spirochaetisodalis TaxID=1560234 RepID=A0A1B7XCY3_9BACT|nr:hypothetical protein SP90_08495 [Halodesulfovibrio spirochaetisodalis]
MAYTLTVSGNSSLLLFLQPSIRMNCGLSRTAEFRETTPQGIPLTVACAKAYQQSMSIFFI